MPTTTEQTRIRGEVERVFFSSANFSAGRFITERGDRIQFAGNVVVQENQPLVLHGKFIRHPKYGFQFEVASMEFDRQMDARGLANYLANNPDIRGIGPAKARIIAERFGSDFERSLIEEPAKIAEVAKVPQSVIESLRDHWLETSKINLAMTALSAYGLTHHQVTKLVKKLGNNAVGIIERDPYTIVGEIDGFGFKRIDKIARQVGIDEKALTCYSADSRFLVAKPFIRQMEEDLARVFARGVKPSPCFVDSSGLQTKVKRIAPRLNSRQLEAAVSAASHSISLISGDAGSGKTFTVAAITRLCDEHELRVVLCAPTGKAAKRIEEATGREASTIHRLLGFNGKTYARDSENPVSADVLIVDEVSMVDVALAWHLFQAIDLERTSVILVGDHNQLPPVGPGNILRDLIESRALPTTVLDDIVRQAGILKENSIAILRGEVPKTPQRDTSVRGAWYVADQHTEAERVQRFILDLFEHTLAEKLGFNILRDVQLLTPTHKGPLGTVELNTKLQRLIQQKLWNYDVLPPQLGRRPKLLVNDKVIQTRNNYDLGVMNGAMGIVRSVGSDGSLTIEFEDKMVNIEVGSATALKSAMAFQPRYHFGLIRPVAATPRLMTRRLGTHSMRSRKQPQSLQTGSTASDSCYVILTLTFLSTWIMYWPTGR